MWVRLKASGMSSRIYTSHRIPIWTLRWSVVSAVCRIITQTSGVTRLIVDIAKLQAVLSVAQVTTFINRELSAHDPGGGGRQTRNFSSNTDVTEETAEDRVNTMII
jgi:hypothetical protein